MAATTLWTPVQQAWVDEILDELVGYCLKTIGGKRKFIEDRDDRPVGVYNLSDPEDGPEKYRFRYVEQGMLEDLIEKLQERV